MKKAMVRILSAFGFLRNDSEDEAKHVVVRYSRGNVRLQFGQIMTDRDYAEQRGKVLAHVFC